MFPVTSYKTRIEPVRQIADLCVVLRSSGERTVCAATDLLTFITARVRCCQDVAPQAEAVRTSYRMALEADEPYSLVLDGDVLPCPAALSYLVRIARHQRDAFAVWGKVLDKPFGGPRIAGHRLYRTDAIPRLLSLLRDDDVRPEESAINRLAEQGGRVCHLNVIVGLHDYEQSLVRLARKGGRFAFKHRRRMPILQAYWREMRHVAADYSALLVGSRRMESNRWSCLDWDNDQEVMAWLARREKPPYEPSDPAKDVEETIATWRRPRHYGLLHMPGGATGATEAFFGGQRRRIAW